MISLGAMSEKKEQRKNITHACEPCRQRKVKCDGNREGCSNCMEYERVCFYGKTKKELNESKLADLQIRVDAYSGLLRQLQPLTDGQSQLAIAKALSSSSAAISQSILGSERSPGALLSNAASPSATSSLHDPASPSSESEYDEQRSVEPPGFMGKPSEVSILHRVIKVLGEDSEDASPEFPQYTCNAYHLDRLDISPALHMNDFQLPDKHLAQKLLSIYLNTVHPLFPILWQDSLMEVYRNVYMPMFSPHGFETELAILNLVFAIAQCFIDRFVRDGDQFGEIHKVYFWRSKTQIELSGGFVFNEVTLQQIQLLGLSAMYLVACSQTNKAWHALGLAQRMAHTIGLHSQPSTSKLGFEHGEQRARTWYSICYLESMLCTMTGRPSVLSYRFSASNTPHTLPHESKDNFASSTSAIDPFMAASAGLSIVIVDILGRLYSKDQENTVTGWEGLRRTVELLAVHLERWRKDLPEVLSFDKPQLDQDFIHKRFDLAVRYNHASLLLHLPYLARPEPLPNALEGAADLKEFIYSSAAQCVEDARCIIHLLVSNFVADGQNTVKLGPWWCILHYAMSSAAVLLLELAQGGLHSPTQQKNVFDTASTVVVWMQAMSSRGCTDAGIRNCCSELVALLSGVSSRLGQHLAPEAIMQRTHHVDPLLTLMPHTHSLLGAGSVAENAPLYFPSTTFLHEPGSSGFALKSHSDDESQY